ncbi:uncharacterized protein J8A68_004168 [[Candida] subhashii]|uniref:RRM domain-containing protein n=1 Tax=[Candida] subhashii TaxID=561895 RepID=A0A8J5QHS2_9ASCO|nr:uncharacterized protein J8A68_004168 [[Candida] subhashii]KAG7662274.1 hypothetical protein J8A68_004168 [[Candida] subhashii]
MLKSFINQDNSFLIESERAVTTTTTTTANNSNNNVLKRSSLSNVSTSIRLPSFGLRDEKKRNNFLKVCSWPFSKMESLPELPQQQQQQQPTNPPIIPPPPPNDEYISDSDNEDRDVTIRNKTIGMRRNNNNNHVQHSGNTPLVGINPSLENINHNSERFIKVFNRMTSRKPQENNNIISKKRVIVLTNIINSMGINSVLQQVCGGPLEKIISLPDGTIELYFIFPEHAKQFYTYGKATGLLMVNGQKLRVEWKDEGEGGYHPQLSKALLTDIISNGCRRCLILSKVVPGKRLRNGDKMFYPEADIHYSQDLDIEEVRSDFSEFGYILDIGSVISRKLCFSIFYDDIRSAIFAKLELETIGSELNLKYKSWSVWYGKDITDRPCFVL